MTQGIEEYKRAISTLREALTEVHCVLKHTYIYAHMDAVAEDKVQSAMSSSELALACTDDIYRNS